MMTAALLTVRALLVLLKLVVSSVLHDGIGAERPTIDAIAEQVSDCPASTSLIGIGCSVLLSTTFMVPAVFVLHGSSAARVAAWCSAHSA